MHLINHSRTSKKYRSWDLSCTVQLRFVCHDETRLRITYVQHRTRWSWRPPQLWGEMRLPRTPGSPPQSWPLLGKMPCRYEWMSCRLQSVEVEIGLSSSSARLQWIGRPACRSISVWYCVCGLMHLELEIYTRADSAAQRLYNAVWPHMALSVNFFVRKFLRVVCKKLGLTRWLDLTSDQINRWMLTTLTEGEGDWGRGGWKQWILLQSPQGHYLK